MCGTGKRSGEVGGEMGEDVKKTSFISSDFGETESRSDYGQENRGGKKNERKGAGRARRGGRASRLYKCGGFGRNQSKSLQARGARGIKKKRAPGGGQLAGGLDRASS